MRHEVEDSIEMTNTTDVEEVFDISFAICISRNRTLSDRGLECHALFP